MGKMKGRDCLGYQTNVYANQNLSAVPKVPKNRLEIFLKGARSGLLYNLSAIFGH